MSLFSGWTYPQHDPLVTRARSWSTKTFVADPFPSLFAAIPRAFGLLAWTSDPAFGFPPAHHSGERQIDGSWALEGAHHG